MSSYTKCVSIPAPIRILSGTNAVSHSDMAGAAMNPAVARFFESQPSLADRTIRQYGNCLAYWHTWHQLRYASPLPILRSPPEGISREVFDQFASDHLARCDRGRLVMSMPAELTRDLEQLGFNEKTPCPTPKTTALRLKVIRRAHRLLGLPYPPGFFVRALEESNSAWVAAKAMLQGPEPTHISADDTARALYAACSPDWEGARDAAMIVLLRWLTATQVRGLRIDNVSSDSSKVSSNGELSVRIPIRRPACDAQRYMPVVKITGDEARILLAWINWRCSEGAENEEPLIIRKSKRRPCSPTPPLHWFSKRMALLARRAGLGPHAPSSPTRLRKATELTYYDSLPLVQIARAADMKVASARKIIDSGAR